MRKEQSMLKCRKPSGGNRIGFPNLNSFVGAIVAEYILINGIKVAKDFTPETFGRLTTIGPKFLLDRKAHIAYQVCLCSCGSVKIVRVAAFRNGGAKSCGCLQKEKASKQATALGKSSTKHGKSRSREYTTYHSMVQRCCNPKARQYQDYGGRGIKVCDRWQESNGQGFINFLVDMNECPPGKISIDRTDNDGDYEPGNCKWADYTEQARNRRSCRLLTYNGRTQTVAEWADETGLKYSTIGKRIDRYGWSIEKTLTTPAKKR
jgi:hypothetical protein